MPAADEPQPGPAPRLLVITPDFPPARGGIQLLVHRVAAGMHGLDTRVVTLRSPGWRAFDAAGALDVVRVPAPPRIGPARNVLLSGAALEQARRMRPDIVLSAHIVTAPAAALIARATGARVVQYFYAKEIGARPRLSVFAAGRADASIVISSYTARLLEEHGAQLTRAVLIPPGVDEPAHAGPLPAGRPTFVTVSRLADPYKGHDVLIRALSLVRERVPDVEWVVIGDGPLRPGLEELARAEGVAGSVRFLGAVTDGERDEWLRRADLFAMPSRLPGGTLAGEGFGIVYLEAGTYGKPVVAGNVAGAVDAVVDGETGLLVDPADPVAVADAVSRLLLDRELAARLGAAGAERARTFAWPIVVARVRELLLAQLGEDGR